MVSVNLKKKKIQKQPKNKEKEQDLMKEKDRRIYQMNSWMKNNSMNKKIKIQTRKAI